MEGAEHRKGRSEPESTVEDRRHAEERRRVLLWSVTNPGWDLGSTGVN